MRSKVDAHLDGHLKPYVQYVPTDDSWLRRIPSTWGVTKLGAIASVKARLGWKGLKAAEYVDEGFIFLSTPNMKSSRIDFDHVDYITAQRYYESPEIMLQDGDVLIAKDGSTLGIANVVRTLPAPATVNSSIAVVRPGPKLNSVYCFYFLSSHYTQSTIARMKDGMGVPHLFQADLRKFKILLPPERDQEAIARFLDHETTSVDEIIGRKRRLIALLEEKRAALIHRAVTKGLEVNVPTKDSGILWIGHIPAHWCLKRLRFVSDLQTGLTLGKDYAEFPTIVRPYLRVANVQDGYLNLDDIAEIRVPKVEAERYELRPGDVLMTEGGDFDKLGRGYVWSGQIQGCLHQNHVFAVRSHIEKLHPLFLAHLTACSYGRAYFTSTSQQTTNLASTNSMKIRAFPVVLPPCDEQMSILEAIGHLASKLDTLIAKVRKQIENLQEYRIALISSAVTGQIDVRQAVDKHSQICEQ